MENGWPKVLQEAGIWPIVHVFLPAVLAIYLQSIWKVLSIIYLWETFEFLLSQIPGLSYWGEISKIDSIVTDILMGVLGIYAVRLLRIKSPEDVPSYAILSPQKIAKEWYTPLAKYLHILLIMMLSSFSAIVVATGFVAQSSFVEFIVFGVGYVFLAGAFGFKVWAVYSAITLLIISTISIFLQYTLVNCLGTILLSTIVVNCYQLNHKPAKNTPPLENQFEKNTIELKF
tara:strand:+ start:86 stop:775 length:690 start_codon:yes stop_codon:yes gene_type:complete